MRHSNNVKQRQVKTGKPTRDSTMPRLPHERDESDDSQTGQHEDMKQAYEDLKSGQVNTDARNIPGVDDVVNDVPAQTPDKVIKKH